MKKAIFLPVILALILSFTSCGVSQKDKTAYKDFELGISYQYFTSLEKGITGFCDAAANIIGVTDKVIKTNRWEKSEYSDFLFSQDFWIFKDSLKKPVSVNVTTQSGHIDTVALLINSYEHGIGELYAILLPSLAMISDYGNPSEITIDGVPGTDSDVGAKAGSRADDEEYTVVYTWDKIETASQPVSCRYTFNHIGGKTPYEFAFITIAAPIEEKIQSDTISPTPDTTHNADIKSYPENIDASRLTGIGPLPDIIFSTTGEENGLVGTVYCFTGKVVECYVNNIEGIDVPSVKVATYPGQEEVNVSNFYGYLFETFKAEGFSDEEIIWFLGDETISYMLPEVGEEVMFYATYAGYLENMKMPSLYLGANEYIISLLTNE